MDICWLHHPSCHIADNILAFNCIEDRYITLHYKIVFTKEIYEAILLFSTNPGKGLV